MADKSNEGTKKNLAKYVTYAIVGILLLSLLLVGVVSCSSDDEKSEQPTSEAQAPVQESQIRKDVGIVFPWVRKNKVDAVPAQAKSVAINDICTPFSTTPQICEFKRMNDGSGWTSGWMGLEVGTPQDMTRCFNPWYVKAARAEDQLITEVWLLLEDGTIKKIEPEELTTSGRAIAMKFVANKKMALSHFLSPTDCTGIRSIAVS